MTCLLNRYLTGSYDPEGALGWLTASVMTFLGLQAGRVLMIYKKASRPGMEPERLREYSDDICPYIIQQSSINYGISMQQFTCANPPVA